MRGIWRGPTNFAVTPEETRHSRSPSPVAGVIGARAPPPAIAPLYIPLPESDEESYGEEEEEAETEADIAEPPEAAEPVEVE